MTQIKERPILFSAAMVNAIRDGRKSMTRREVKFPSWVCGEPERGNSDGELLAPHEKTGCLATIPCRYGQVGERLWVREAFCTPSHGDTRHRNIKHLDYFYRADCGKTIHTDCSGFTVADSDCKWRPSIHMPREASRILLELTGVKVERLQDISAKDIMAEGVILRSHDNQYLGKCPISAFDECCYPDLKSLWAAGWEKINGKGSWKANPWTLAISFRVLEGGK